MQNLCYSFPSIDNTGFQPFCAAPFSVNTPTSENSTIERVIDQVREERESGMRVAKREERVRENI